ncbi:MAG: LPXTG cell wall anchor domain-containing protein [Acidimicrobiia bacterium]|nr:LPXTG cell wall anchor domain-containing protein [Acidimicrobiia bacterium]
MPANPWCPAAPGSSVAVGHSQPSVAAGHLPSTGSSRTIAMLGMAAVGLCLGGLSLRRRVMPPLDGGRASHALSGSGRNWT